VIGLLTSGALLAAFSWRSIFVLNTVLAVVALLGALRFVPESADPNPAPLDVVGAAIAVAALVVLVFSVIEAPTYGWVAARTIAGLILAVVLIVAFIVWELQQKTPLLNPRVFRKRPLSAGSMSIFVQFFAFYGYAFLAMQYLQIVRGDTALLAAVQVLPLTGAMIPISRQAPRLTARFGRRNVCAVGLVLVAVGLAIVAQLGTDTPYWLMALGLAVLGVGMGAAMTPATSSITEALPLAQQGVGSALNDLSREVGGAIGIAVIGSIFTATYSSSVNVSGLSSQIAGQVKSSYAIASTMAAPIPDRVNDAFVSAMHVSLLTAAGAAVLAAIGVVVLLAGRSPQASAMSAGGPESVPILRRSGKLGHSSPTAEGPEDVGPTVRHAGM
jgi:MFS family permease